MMPEADTEAVLTPEDLRAILRVCSTDGVLVGGQALAFWADHFAVWRPADLVPAVSTDADFLAGKSLAKKLAKALGWKCWIPRDDDATFQTAKVTHRQRNGSVKQVDFLAVVAGLATRDVIRRALTMEVSGIGRLRVMHPIDVIESRIQNLALIPAKRTRAGVSQAKLAIEVIRAFMLAEIDERGERAALQWLERVAAIAASNEAVRAYLEFDVNPLLGVPMEGFRTSTALHTRRWPQLVAVVERKRAGYRRRRSK